jgi:mercuric ion binding protein
MRVLIIAILSLWLSGAQAATPVIAVLDVENMTCAACGLTIKAALQRESGVTSTVIDGVGGTVTVHFDKERITVDRVAVAITEAGFPAKPRSAHER